MQYYGARYRSAILPTMLMPEVTHYGRGPNQKSDSYHGVMYRFLGAEHISVESSSRNVHIALSTREDPDSVRRSYETIFGVKAISEPPQEETYEDDEPGQLEIRARSAAISLGPMCIYVVDTDKFSLCWNEPDQVFHDRTDTVATVYMRQENPDIDMRHRALLSSLAEENVKEWLDKILDDTLNG